MRVEQRLDRHKQAVDKLVYFVFVEHGGIGGFADGFDDACLAVEERLLEVRRLACV